MSEQTMDEEQFRDCLAIKRLKVTVDEGISEYPEKKNDEVDNVPSQQGVGVAHQKTTSDDSISESISASPVTPEERVFGTDHLVELICSSMDRESLMNCRLLNSRWTVFGAKALKMMVKIQLTGYFWNSSEKDVKPSLSYQSIQRLPQLMKASFEFPCTSFSFEIRRANEFLSASFFNEVGTFIKKLHLIATLDFEDLEKLLFFQCPNLEHFTLKGMHSHSTLDRPRKATGYGSRFMFVGIHRGLKDGRNQVPKGYFLQKRMSQNSAVQEGKLHPSKAYKLKLQYFEIDCFYDFEFPSELLPEILNYSPNLRQVKFPSFLYPFLMAPNVNRLHLLQTIQIFVSNKNVALLDLLASQPKGSLSFVKELILMGSDYVARDDSEQDIIFHPELWPQVEISISKILLDVSGSCEKLVLPQMGFLENVVIPKMGLVRRLKLRYVHCFGVFTKFFPVKNGITWSIAEMFPNFEKLTVYCLGKQNIPNSETVRALFENLVFVNFLLMDVDSDSEYKMNKDCLVVKVSIRPEMTGC